MIFNEVNFLKMNPTAHSSNQNENNEYLDPYQQKWRGIFEEDFNVNEELDYEYSEDEYQIADDFPLTYTWSPSSSRSSSNCSSPACTRPSSPIGGVINLIHEDEDENVAQRHSLKKLTRDFYQIYTNKQNTLSTFTRKNWKKNADFKGILKRWRIRSLDAIFIKKNGRHYCHQVPRRPINIQTGPRIKSEVSETDEVSGVAIVVNNDLCQNNERVITPEMPIHPPPMRIATDSVNSTSQDSTLSLYPNQFQNAGQCSSEIVGSCSQSCQITEYRTVSTSKQSKSQGRFKSVNNQLAQRYLHPPTATGRQDNLVHHPVSSGSSTTVAIYRPQASYPMEPFPAHIPMPMPFRPPFILQPPPYIPPPEQRPNQYYNPGPVQNGNNGQYN